MCLTLVVVNWHVLRQFLKMQGNTSRNTWIGLEVALLFLVWVATHPSHQVNLEGQVNLNGASSVLNTHRRNGPTSIWGGADRVLPEWIRWGGVVA